MATASKKTAAGKKKMDDTIPTLAEKGKVLTKPASS